MEKGDRVKIELLTVATQLLVERGDTKKVTFRDIAAKAAVPTSKITYYFPTRQKLLAEISGFVLEHTRQSPLTAFLEKNRTLLDSREGQIFFIDDLFRCFHRYFLGVQCVNLNCGLALRILQCSTEHTPGKIHKTFRPAIQDARAFLEIYRAITGSGDLEQASFLFATTLYALAHRLAKSKPLKRINETCVLDDDFDIKFLYFCRKQLLLGLGLWEAPVPGNGSEVK